MVVGRSKSESKPRVLVEDSDCGGCNAGQCVAPTIADPAAAIDPSSTVGFTPSCDCRGTPFIGEHCEVPCSKECQNGGKCAPPPDGEDGEEGCSCSKAVVDGNPFAGLECEYGATTLCMHLGSESKHSFCTNEGGCRDIVGDNERHEDCICVGEFEGPHCEYVAGTKPEGGDVVAGATAAEGGSQQQQDSPSQWAASSNSNVIVYAMIAVTACLIMLLLLAIGMRARRRRAESKRLEREAREATEDLSMIPTHNQPETEII